MVGDKKPMDEESYKQGLTNGIEYCISRLQELDTKEIALNRLSILLELIKEKDRRLCELFQD